MRELKFRAWCEKIQYYFYDVAIYPNGVVARKSNALPDILTEGETHWHELDNAVIEQYTGLKDKNGKEIYEGDIVEYTTHYYGNEKRHRKVVEWEEWDSDDFGEPHNLGYFNLSEYMTVIGNIHENPELLEEK